MLELLNSSVLWWHWIVLGVVLLIIEMSSGTFVILGLGIAAIVVGIFDYLAHTSFTFEIVTWTILSIVYFVAWKQWFKNETVSNSGQSDYSLDTLGTVTQEIHVNQKGKVAFDTPVLGNTTWHTTSTQKIEKGARVRITDVNGQLLEVEKI